MEAVEGVWLLQARSTGVGRSSPLQGSSRPKDRTQGYRRLQAGFLTSEPPGKLQLKGYAVETGAFGVAGFC